MAFDIEKVKAMVKTYADEVRQLMPVGKVFLYGSYEVISTGIEIQ